MSTSSQSLASVLAPGIRPVLEDAAWPIEVKDLGCLGVLANIWDEHGLTELIDVAVPGKESGLKMSRSDGVELVAARGALKLCQAAP